MDSKSFSVSGSYILELHSAKPDTFQIFRSPGVSKFYFPQTQLRADNPFAIKLFYQ